MNNYENMAEAILLYTQEMEWDKAQKKSQKKSQKRIIRTGCFETNSSSMHSIVITKNDCHIDPEKIVYDRDKEYNDETIYLSDGCWHLREISDGFGRYPFQLLTTMEDKFKYAMCEYLGCYYGDEDEFDDNYNMFLELAKEIIPGFEEFYIYTHEVEIYHDQDGNELKHSQLKYDGWDGEKKEYIYTYKDKDGNTHPAILSDEYYEVPRIGSIDHQSSGLLRNFLKDKNISLKEFLTNKRYVVVIDGDEICDWIRYKKSGLINMDFIIEEYGESNDDKEWAEYVKEHPNWMEEDFDDTDYKE